jgi:hypothetical protein
MLKPAQFVHSRPSSRSADAAFLPWLHVVVYGVCRFFLLRLARLIVARVDLHLRQFSFFLAQVFSG